MKNDYNKNYFWIVQEETRRRYYFKLNGELHEVNKDVFNVCYNSYKKQQRDIKRDINAGLVSLDEESENNIPILERLSSRKDYSEIDKIQFADNIQLIMNEINKLEEHERELITNLLIKEKTEKELAEQLHMTQQGINYKKKAIIKKIKKNLNK